MRANLSEMDAPDELYECDDKNCDEDDEESLVDCAVALKVHHGRNSSF